MGNIMCWNSKNFSKNPHRKKLGIIGLESPCLHQRLSGQLPDRSACQVWCWRVASLSPAHSPATPMMYCRRDSLAATYLNVPFLWFQTEAPFRLCFSLRVVLWWRDVCRGRLGFLFCVGSCVMAAMQPKAEGMYKGGLQQTMQFQQNKSTSLDSKSQRGRKGKRSHQSECSPKITALFTSGHEGNHSSTELGGSGSQTC